MCDLFGARTLVDLAEVNFSVYGAYYYSYSCFCADSFDYGVAEVVVYLTVAYLMATVAVAASDCISPH